MSELEPAAEPLSPGRTLAAARAGLNLSVADVSQQIKYAVRQIAAIEADDYAKLPGTTFVRGMIRSYAKLVQIDPLPLLAELGRRDLPPAAAVDLHTGEREPFLEGGKKSNRIYVFLSLAALLAVAVVAYEWYASSPPKRELAAIPPKVTKGEPAHALPPQPSPAEQPSAAAQPGAASPPGVTGAQTVELQRVEPQRIEPRRVELKSQVAPMPAPAIGNMPGGSKRIQLEFDQLSWVEIKQANGAVLLSQLNPAGSKQSIEGAPPFEVVIGNAANVRMRYNEAPVDLRPYSKFDVARLTLE
jgi:cytoskeleton protein RodZ